MISHLFQTGGCELSFGTRALEEVEHTVGPLSDQRTEGVRDVGVSLLSECVILGNSELLALRSEGDVIIGGLFPVHYLVPNSQNTYNSKPQNLPCNGFDDRAFRWMMTMIFAVEEINRNPALLPGVTLGYHIMDSCDHIHTSLKALLSLLTHSTKGQNTLDSGRCLTGSPITAVVGLASSSPTGAIAHILGPFSIPLVSYFATCACLTDKHTYPSFLRTVPSDLFQVRGLVELVKFFGWNWVGTVGTPDDYSRYGIQAFSHQFRQLGGCLAYHLTIPQSPTFVEIGAMADTLQSSKAKVVVAFATEGQLLELFSEFHLLLQGTLGFSFPGVYIPGLREFLLKVRPKAEPGFEFHNMLWEEVFDCRLETFLFSAQENTTDSPERPVCTGSEDLSNVHNSYTELSKVRISYNVYKAVYAIAHALHDLLECGSVGATTAEAGCKKNASKPIELLGYLKMVNFTNQFGEKVHFDDNGEPVPLYDIINWQKDSKGKIRFVKVGSYDGSVPMDQQLQLNQSKIVWTGGLSQVPVSLCSDPCPPGSRQARRPGEPQCCFDCLPCAEGEISNQTDSTECTKCQEYYWSDKRKVECVAGVDDFLSVYDTMGIILITLTLLGVVMTTVITTVFHHFRATPIVRANNSEISFLLLVSLKLCFLCSLAFIGKPSTWTCRLRQAAFGVSFVLCLSCLLVKTIVVLLAFRSTGPGSGAMKLFGPAQQRTLILCTTAPQVCLCAGWLSAAPPFPFRNPTYQASTGMIVVECRELWPAGFYLVLGYIGLLASLCLLLAYLGRKLPDTFNEAKLITFSMIIFCAVWLSFIPAHVSSPGKFTVAVEIFAILASSFGLLLCIFVPKCFIILAQPEKNIKKRMIKSPR
ncbi:extracellular calcium-sensing receptor [Gadus chalcogrammus]|uniref:extracellular calcium-sensing receptor n=1 Tax=Gadus chalcogrammus TaxID=1042646 RepID=UPI0024C47941|nr:extracellular calcium-sensing receptor [Gadus chalcogrammus]